MLTALDALQGGALGRVERGPRPLLGEESRGGTAPAAHNNLLKLCSEFTISAILGMSL